MDERDEVSVSRGDYLDAVNQQYHAPVGSSSCVSAFNHRKTLGINHNVSSIICSSLVYACSGSPERSWFKDLHQVWILPASLAFPQSEAKLVWPNWHVRVFIPSDGQDLSAAILTYVVFSANKSEELEAIVRVMVWVSSWFDCCISPVKAFANLLSPMDATKILR